MEKQKYTEGDMEKYLSDRYSHPYEWVFLTQVRSSTGSASRIADAMAFNMYQSTGHEILGFEIKVSRSDWLSELKDMGKSNELMEYCDKWFLVVPDADIVKDDELPKGWGLLVLKGDKLVMKVRPTLQTTEPIPDHFLASILRRNSDMVKKMKNKYILKEEVEEDRKKAEQNGYDRGVGYNGKHFETKYYEMEEKFNLFEELTGIRMNSWSGIDNVKNIGAFVKIALDMDSYTLDSSIRTLTGTIQTLEKGITELKKCKKAIGSSK